MKKVAQWVKEKAGVLSIGAGALALTSQAHAVAVLDFSGAVTKATEELTAAISTGMPLFGLVAGIGVGIAVFHKLKRG